MMFLLPLAKCALFSLFCWRDTLDIVSGRESKLQKAAMLTPVTVATFKISCTDVSQMLVSVSVFIFIMSERGVKGAVTSLV